MSRIITSDVLIAYSRCPRKAFLLLCTNQNGTIHEYVNILEHKAQANQHQFISDLRQKSSDVQSYSIANLKNGAEFLTNVILKVEGLEATCGLLTKIGDEQSSRRNYHYEPTIFIGTHKIRSEQKLALFFVAHVLGLVQNKSPMKGKIIGADGKSHRVKLENSQKILFPLVGPLQEWADISSDEPPPIILNKHCSTCQFRDMCRKQAEQEDNLSLLDRVTPKVIRKYEKKGIFTVKQLSYLYKPRRRKKRARKPVVTHNLELQALAIRTRKIYLQDLPDLSRQPVEIFLDIEGIPDQQAFYLIGLLVCEADSRIYHSFWADTLQDETHIWQDFLEMVNLYPNAPIYHYGSYEPRALAQLSRRYESDGDALKSRLVNINTFIYGRVYFPVYSNGLKAIGEFIGFKWTAQNASGLQSLVWRHHWDEAQDTEHQQILLTYNEEDCRALMLLANELTKIKTSADTMSEVDFADQLKQEATGDGEVIHSQFDAILKFAHADYDKKKISFRRESQQKEKSQEPKKVRGRYKKRKHRVTKTIHLPHRKNCPKCNTLLRPTELIVSGQVIIDLVPTRTGMRKTVTKYVGFKGYCTKCYRHHVPTEFCGKGRSELYGHGLQVWCVYLRISLRMPYSSIIEIVEEQFSEKISLGIVPTFMRNIARDHTETEQNIIQRLLESPFVHADETAVNIRGSEQSGQYVWVFTDGERVILRLTETREADIVHEFLAGYEGVLISDFYPGYDSVQCRQQKCWVHLIRDMNNDLWGAPFDAEYEAFILEVRDLMIPIMEAIQKYGSKKRNLNKFRKGIDKFYSKVITGKRYKSELALKYQTRFVRYRESLFTFLEQDRIPWQNNAAERALRHLIVQEKISGSFFASLMPDYLRLLGIKQTCRFQGKPFFRFLFSGEKDLDNFKASKS